MPCQGWRVLLCSKTWLECSWVTIYSLFFTKVKVLINLVTMYLCYLPVWPLGQAVKALNSQFRGPRFKSRPDHLLDLYSVVPSSNSRPHL